MNPFSAFFLQTDSEQNFKQINRLLSFKEETTTQQINVRPTDQLDVKLTIFKILMLNNYNQQLYCPKKNPKRRQHEEEQQYSAKNKHLLMLLLLLLLVILLLLLFNCCHLKLLLLCCCLLLVLLFGQIN